MRRRKNLSSFERASIIQFLLEDSKDGKPARGKMTEAVTKRSSSRKTISRIWAAAKKQQQNGEVISSMSRKMLRPRRKRVQIDLQLIASLDLSKRSTIKRLASGIQCSKSTVERWIQIELIKAHSNAIKPDLMAPNKLLRLRFSLEALEYDRILRTLTFKSMHNTVHIDEKWFYITKTSQRFYLTPGETEPHRTCKSKKFITKVMFMCVVCRPIFGPDGGCMFDGKIDIFSFTEMVPAKRKSNSFNELSPMTLNKVFLSLQSCMIEILKVKGKNSYKTPHLKKDALLRQDMLPLNLEVSIELVRECIFYLIEKGSLNGGDDLLQQLGVNADTTDEFQVFMHQLQLEENAVV